jgi:hypothetical protein
MMMPGGFAVMAVDPLSDHLVHLEDREQDGKNDKAYGCSHGRDHDGFNE